MIQCWIDSENRLFLSYILPELKRKYQVTILKDTILNIFDTYLRMVLLNANDGECDHLFAFFSTEIKEYTQLLKHLHLLLNKHDIIDILKIGTKILANFPDMYKPYKWPRRQLNIISFKEPMIEFLPAFDIQAQSYLKGVLNRALLANT